MPAASLFATSMAVGAGTEGAARWAGGARAAHVDCGCDGARGLPHTRTTAVIIRSCVAAAEASAASSRRMQPARHSVRCSANSGARATAAPSPFSTSSSADASLHTLWGGRQSSRFTSATVLRADASTTNTRLPSPPELRNATWMAPGASAVLAAGARCCIGELRFQAQRESGGGEQASFPKGALFIADSGAELLLGAADGHLLPVRGKQVTTVTRQDTPGRGDLGKYLERKLLRN